MLQTLLGGGPGKREEMQLSSGEKVYIRGVLGEIWVYRVYWRRRQRFSGVYPKI